MYKIYQLTRPTDHDETAAIIVCAESPDDARSPALCGDDAWEHAACRPLGIAGAARTAGVVLYEFRTLDESRIPAPNLTNKARELVDCDCAVKPSVICPCNRVCKALQTERDRGTIKLEDA